MLRHLHDRETILAALTLPLNAELHALLAERIAHLEAHGWLEMTEIVVLDATTTEAELVNAVGFTPLTDLDGRRFGQPGFTCVLGHVARVSPTYHQAILTVGNSGFAFEPLVPDDAHSELVALCKQLAV